MILILGISGHPPHAPVSVARSHSLLEEYAKNKRVGPGVLYEAPISGKNRKNKGKGNRPFQVDADQMDAYIVSGTKKPVSNDPTLIEGIRKQLADLKFQDKKSKIKSPKSLEQTPPVTQKDTQSVPDVDKHNQQRESFRRQRHVPHVVYARVTTPSSSLPDSTRTPHHCPYYLLPPQPLYLRNRKTVFLDLDETLVHASFERPVSNSPAAFQIVVPFDDGTQEKYYIYKRPGVDEFLRKLSSRFEVVIFTASTQPYADAILDTLDPYKTLFHYRLYRDSCFEYKQSLIKLLHHVGRPIEKVMLVDNSPIAYAINPAHALPISSYYPHHPTDPLELPSIYDLLLKWNEQEKEYSWIE